MTDTVHSLGFAFFDVDDTLISVKSMFSFQEHWYAMTGDRRSRLIFDEEMTQLRWDNAPWEIMHRRYYSYFAGRDVMDVDRCAQSWFDKLEREKEDLYNPNIVRRLAQHQAEGKTVVFVSGSFPALLTPIAQALNVSHMLATRMIVKDGRYTGKVLAPRTIGEGKAEAIRGFLRKSRVSPDICHAYGDDISDFPMLASVGHPTAVLGGRGLEPLARQKGWEVLAPR